MNLLLAALMFLMNLTNGLPAPGGSSFGGVFSFRRAKDESKYAFDLGGDSKEEQENIRNYQKFLDSIIQIEEYFH